MTDIRDWDRRFARFIHDRKCQITCVNCESLMAVAISNAMRTVAWCPTCGPDPVLATPEQIRSLRSLAYLRGDA